MFQPLRVLLIDDSDDDAALMLRHLREAGLDVISTLVASGRELEAALDDDDWDVALCDFKMPGFDPFAAIEILRERGIDIPFIVMSGYLPEEELVRVMQAGVDDIVQKDRLARLVPAIERGLEAAAARRERRRSESNLVDAIESISEGFALYDPDDRLVVCNTNYRRLNDPIADVMAPGTRFEDIAQAGADRGHFISLDGKAPEELIAELVDQHRNGSRPVEQRLGDGRWILTSERRTPNGGIASIQSDITDRKLAQIALEEKERFTRLVLDSVADAIITIDADGCVLSFNRSAEKMFGYSASEVAGQNVGVLMPEPYSSRHDGYIERYLTTGVSYAIGAGPRHLFGERKDGTDFPIEINVTGSSVSGKPVFVGVARDISARQHAERAIRQSEAQFRAAFESAPHGMALVAPDGRWLAVNKALCEIVGYSEAELLAADLQTVVRPDDIDADREFIGQVVSGKRASYQTEMRCVHKDGHIVPTLLSASLVRDEVGEPAHFVCQIVDLTEREAAQARIAHAEKMEAIGQLTGGIAHDFNNLLLVVMGNLQLLQRGIAGDRSGGERIAAALGAAERGADLTKRLLAYSRRQQLELAVIDVAQLIDGMGDLLDRTLGENIELQIIHDGKPSQVAADPNQLETAILNLAINARDAMPDGGQLTVEHRRLTIDKTHTPTHRDIAPGNYLCIAVSDTGSGIPADIIDHVFEPFFTTKEVGKGTGLGLSMVYGFVKQSNGDISVYSEQGEGTSVKIYLPLAEVAERADEAEAAPGVDSVTKGGGETILVVEDDPAVRDIATSALAELGYRVLEAENGKSALAIIRGDGGGGIDLMFADIVMPGGMDGVRLADEVLAIRPGIKVLFASGFAEAATLRRNTQLDRSRLIGKPYRIEELARKVRDVLAGGAAAA
jgi:PAS domain S-box-containing protein